MEETIKALSSRIHAVEQTLQKLITLFERDVGKSTGQAEAPLSLKQAAAYLHISPSHLYSLIYSGAIKPVQRTKGSRILFTPSTLNNYLHDTQSSRTNRQRSKDSNTHPIHT